MKNNEDKKQKYGYDYNSKTCILGIEPMLCMDI